MELKVLFEKVEEELTVKKKKRSWQTKLWKLYTTTELTLSIDERFCSSVIGNSYENISTS
jgi:hypothetical protein